MIELDTSALEDRSAFGFVNRFDEAGRSLFDRFPIVRGIGIIINFKDYSKDYSAEEIRDYLRQPCYQLVIEE